MKNVVIFTTLIALLALPVTQVFAAGEVVIYTGTVQWISKDAADAQAQICIDMLNDAGINNTLYDSDGDMDALANWMEDVTGDNGLDICVLYGDIPPLLYPQGNTMPDGSVGEMFIESTDGDAILNHADYMFWGLSNRNAEGGLQNMMDIPGIVMWDDNTPMIVTDEGKDISPSLPAIQSDRPFHIDQLAGDWEVEVSLAQNEAGTRADPIIVRDGDRGRLIPTIQTANGDEPKGAVAAEIIIWLMANATAVQPEGKLSTTWGDLKAVR
ncbi:hypothetical protein F4212_03890 [Candidatus Poribacteria bacterium]|nr:hypothetical protein [Candidatus Poribacteria bacterium]